MGVSFPHTEFNNSRPFTILFLYLRLESIILLGCYPSTQLIGLGCDASMQLIGHCSLVINPLNILLQLRWLKCMEMRLSLPTIALMEIRKRVLYKDSVLSETNVSYHKYSKLKQNNGRLLD